MVLAHAVCRFDDLDDGGARSFLVGADRLDVVVLRRGAGAIAYVNSCPHQGTPLETFPDRFLNENGTLLVCSTHGARFRVEDGLCVTGPCVGKALKRIPARVIDEMIVVEA